MKRNILFLFLTLCSVYSVAQSLIKAKPGKTGNEWHAAGDAVQRSKEFSDRLTKTLSLNAATAKKVHDAYLVNTKSVDETKIRPGSASEKKELLKSNKDAFNETLKNILTPAQFDRYLKLPSDRSWEL